MTNMIEPVSRCPFCSLPYDAPRVRLILSKDDRDLIHATCYGCHRAMMFSVERKEEHVSCVGLFTDCDAQDAMRFLGKPKISLDDVLRIHELLSEKM